MGKGNVEMVDFEILVIRVVYVVIVLKTDGMNGHGHQRETDQQRLTFTNSC